MVSVFHGAVLSAVGPTFKGLRSQIGAELETALEKTKFLIEQKPDELNASDYAVLLTCLGNAFAAHSLLGGPQSQLDIAVEAYQIALGHVTVDTDPIVWLITQNHLGVALKSKGEKAKDVEVLKQALQAHTVIIEQLNPVAPL